MKKPHKKVFNLADKSAAIDLKTLLFNPGAVKDDSHITPPNSHRKPRTTRDCTLAELPPNCT